MLFLQMLSFLLLVGVERDGIDQLYRIVGVTNPSPNTYIIISLRGSLNSLGFYILEILGMKSLNNFKQNSKYEHSLSEMKF